VKRFDIILLIFLVLSGLLGWEFGLVRSLFSWAAFFLGIALAGRFYRRLSTSVFGNIAQPGIAMVISFVTIFVFVIIIIDIPGFWLDRLIADSMLNWVNKIGGAVFGLLTGGFTLGAVLAIILRFFGNQTFITKSAIASFLADKFLLVLKLLPGKFNVLGSIFPFK
jgi:membrane protein required for colicin V production